MTLERNGVTTLRRYSKPSVIQISITQVLLDLIERAERDEQLTAHLQLSIHQAEPEYRES
jgi:hypothetical protein